jgi:hypothetical protein
MRHVNRVIVTLALVAAASSARADHARPGVFSDIGTPPAVEDQSHGNTTNALMIERCTSFLKTLDADPEGHIRDYRHDYQTGFCLGWINASMVFLNFRDSNGAETLGVCMPEGTHSLTVIKAFLDYAKRHDDDLKYSPSFLIYWAMLEKYPCKK